MLQQQVEQLLVQEILEFIHLQDQVIFVYLVQVMQEVQIQFHIWLLLVVEVVVLTEVVVEPEVLEKVKLLLVVIQHLL